MPPQPIVDRRRPPDAASREDDRRHRHQEARVVSFYSLSADAGAVTLTGTGKNAPSGMANALGASLQHAEGRQALLDQPRQHQPGQAGERALPNRQGTAPGAARRSRRGHHRLHRGARRSDHPAGSGLGRGNRGDGRGAGVDRHRRADAADRADRQRPGHAAANPYYYALNAGPGEYGWSPTARTSRRRSPTRCSCGWSTYAARKSAASRSATSRATIARLSPASWTRASR